jgi:hypothetical protein
MKARWLVFLILVLSLPIHAATVKRLDMDGLVTTAQTIVVGQVTSSHTYWTSDGRLILTRHTIEVDETLKGVSSGTVEVTTIGGTIGDQTLYVSGMPAFGDGERTVLFLESTGRYRTVVGLGQGKFSIDGGLVSNEVSELKFADGRRGRPMRLRLDEFKDDIRRRLRR